MKPIFIKNANGTIMKLTLFFGDFYNEKGELIDVYRSETIYPQAIDAQIIDLQTQKQAIADLDKTLDNIG